MDLFRHLMLNLVYKWRRIFFIAIRKLKQHLTVAMIKFSLLLFQTCTAVFITSQILVPIFALKKTSIIDKLMFENERTRLRQNYVMQRAFNNEMDNVEAGVTYRTENLDNIINPEDMSAYKMDYADIVSDNYVETRTRKRGNRDLEMNHVPCSCEEEDRELEFLGDDYIPRTVDHRICNQKRCPSPYGCHRRIYDIPVLKRRNITDVVSLQLPEDLQNRWVIVKHPVIVGCMCSKIKEYIYSKRSERN